MEKYSLGFVFLIWKKNLVGIWKLELLKFLFFQPKWDDLLWIA